MEGEENGARMFKVFQVFFLRLAKEAGIFAAKGTGSPSLLCHGLE